MAKNYGDSALYMNYESRVDSCCVWGRVGSTFCNLFGKAILLLKMCLEIVKSVAQDFAKYLHWHICKALLDRLETPSHHEVSGLVYIKRKTSKERDQHHVLDRRPTPARGQGKGGQGSKQQSGHDKKKKSNIGCMVQNKEKIQGKCSVARKGDII